MLPLRRLVAGQTFGICNSPFQQAVQVLGLALPHQPFSHLVASETVLALESRVHGHHLGAFAVADLAFEG